VTVFKPRTRIVSFRVSEEEYENLKTLSRDCGARSVSDFARLITQQQLGGEFAFTGFMGTALEKLKRKVRHLDTEIRQLGRLVAPGVREK
jgi:hypothetical protein